MHHFAKTPHPFCLEFETVPIEGQSGGGGDGKSKRPPRRPPPAATRTHGLFDEFDEPNAVGESVEFLAAAVADAEAGSRQQEHLLRQKTSRQAMSSGGGGE